MTCRQIKLFKQKLDGKPFKYNEHNQKMYDVFDVQASAGLYEVTIKKEVYPKTMEQLGYWYGGIIETMVQQMLERGDDVLYEIDIDNHKIPVMTNKTNCDALLKIMYMASIGKAGKAFTKGNSNIEEMSKLISWTLDYLPRYKSVFVMSAEEWKRRKE